MNFEGGASSLSSSDARTLVISSVTVAESWLRFLLAGFISEISVLLGDSHDLVMSLFPSQAFGLTIDRQLEQFPLPSGPRPGARPI